jgi:hypothetical protein
MMQHQFVGPSSSKCLILLAVPTGLEPVTFGLGNPASLAEAKTLQKKARQPAAMERKRREPSIKLLLKRRSNYRSHFRHRSRSQERASN